MRWARHHLENSRGLLWPAGGPRWHLIVNSAPNTLVGACHRPVLPPFEMVSEIPANMRCRKCDDHGGAGAIDAEMTESPRPRAMGLPERDELLALRAIVVSSRNAWHKAPDPDDRERIKDRRTELLAGLAEAAIRRAADAHVLAALDEAQREVWG